MIALILTVCLVAAPADCRDEPSPYPLESPIGCQVLAQRYAAEWVDEHPGWELRGWRCQLPRAERKA
jgi:hypothetical protein